MDKPKTENKRFYPKPHDVAMVYIGEGRRVDDIPARDLNPGEVMRYGGRFYLRRTGLYVDPVAIKND